MSEPNPDLRWLEEAPVLDQATLVLALSGWMDGGDVSTGTVRRLVDLLDARPVAQIDPEPYYLYNFPGSMEVTALFRPPIKIEDGLITSLEMPANTIHVPRIARPAPLDVPWASSLPDEQPANPVLFLGKEPNLRWRSFGDCIFEVIHRLRVRRVLFVGSFGGAVPHTREPRLYFTCSSPELLTEMKPYGLRRTAYEGPGSFTSYLLTRAPAEKVEMVSLVAEIPGYLQGRNPMSIEAVTRRLAKLLKLPLDLQSLRKESTEWELEVSRIVRKDKKLAETVRELEEAYDNELLEREEEQADSP